MKRVGLECYAGYRANERPTRLTLGEQTMEIVDVEDKYVEAQDVWSLEAYRSGAN